MTVFLLINLVLGGLPMPAPGTAIAIPEHFYRRIGSVDEMPAHYGTRDWGEGHFGNWIEVSRARGRAAVETLVRRLGEPLMLAPWHSDGRAREAYVYRLKTTDQAGLIIIVDRKNAHVLLRHYSSWSLPLDVKARPGSHEWERMLMTWFRWLTTPDEDLPPNLRAAGASHPFTLTAAGEEWIMPGMVLPLIAGLSLPGAGVPRPGGRIVVPGQYYRDITDPAERPAGYGEPGWMEVPYPAPVGPLRAKGPAAVETALAELGPPLVLPALDGKGTREAWLFALKAHPEGGLLVDLDRQAGTLELRVYGGPRLPAHIPATPMEPWWHELVRTWWRAQVEPGFELPEGARPVDPPPAR